MHNDEKGKIVRRFFKVLYKLQALKIIRGKKTFTDRYNINRWNFITLEKNPETGTFHIEWLTYLVNDYGVSAHWLLTGKGKMFTIEPVPLKAFTYNKKGANRKKAA